MAFHPLSRFRARRITAAALVLALVSSFLLLTAGSAAAHHPEILSAETTCVVDGYLVEFVSQSWALTTDDEGRYVNGGLNPDIDVQVDLPGDDRGRIDLVAAGGSIAFGESEITAGNGAYTDATSPVRTFAGEFTVAAGHAWVEITVTAVAPWGNHVGPGASESLIVELPAPGECARPTATSAFQCVSGTGVAMVQIANDTSDSVEFEVTVTGPGGFSEVDAAVVGSSNSPVVVTHADLLDGEYAVAVTADGEHVVVGGVGSRLLIACDAAVGDRAWQDWNRNGIQDLGEPDQPVGVIALSTGATDTDGDGRYLFDGLDPDQDYAVTFAAVSGLGWAPAYVGDDDHADSDVDASGVAPVPDLVAGETDLSVDAGYWLDGPPPVCASGDLVWVNSIDLSTVNRIGLPRMDVRLVTGQTTSFTVPGPLPVEFSGAVEVSSIEAVSWDGYWTRPSTTAQPNERWRIVFTLDGTRVGASGYTFDIADGVYNAGWSGLLDIGNGLTLPDGADGIVIEHWSVAQDPTGPDSVVPVALCISTEPLPASLGDRVWFDADADGLQGSDEPGIPGMTVNLLTSEGATAATTQTDAGGFYEFPGLDPEFDYVVEFVRLGGVFTVPNIGDDRAIDSDANPATGRSAVIELDPGEHDPTIDAGVVALTAGIDIEKGTNGIDADQPSGPVLVVGSDVTWTYVVTNTGAYDLADVIVTDDQGVIPVRIDISDVGGDDILSVGESWTYVAFGTAIDGPYTNLGDVVGSPVVNGEPARDPFGHPVGHVTDQDPSHYVGFVPGAATIDIEKHTNGLDADSADPAVNDIPEVVEAGAVTWVYTVTNTSDSIWLADIVVTDDVIGEICVIDGPLAPLAPTQCEATGVATLGAYENIGDVVGSPVNSDGSQARNPDGSVIPSPTDSDPSHYLGVTAPIEVLPEVKPPVPPVSPLAVTGSESRTLAMAALLLIGAGLALIFGSRRRRENLG